MATKSQVLGDNIKTLFLGKEAWATLLKAVKQTEATMRKQAQQLAENAVADMYLHGSTARFCMGIEALQGRKGKPDGRASQRVQAFIAYVRAVSGQQVAKLQELEDGHLSCKMKDGWTTENFDLKLLETPYYAYMKETVPAEVSITAILQRMDKLTVDVRTRGDKIMKARADNLAQLVEDFKTKVAELPTLKVEEPKTGPAEA
jgi:hypothetical protein